MNIISLSVETSNIAESHFDFFVRTLRNYAPGTSSTWTGAILKAYLSEEEPAEEASGEDEADLEDGRLGERAQGALQVLRLAARGNAILPMQSVSEVRVEGEGEVVLYLADHPFPIRFGKENLQAKFNDLLRILKQLYDKGEIGQVAALEMGYGENRNKMLCRWAQTR